MEKEILCSVVILEVSFFFLEIIKTPRFSISFPILEMLYLIRTFGRGKRTALKVGFTDSLDKRLGNYYISNPFFEPVSIRSGDLFDETRMHLYLEALGWKECFLNEWFLDCPEVITEFHAKKRKMDNTIWKFRDSVFIPEDFKKDGNKIKKNIYQELLETRELSAKSEIDKSWLMIRNKTFLKEYRKSMYG